MNTLKLIEIVEAADKDFALAQVPAETLEKFAELIVKECANIAEHADGNWPADQIKQYFGVEQ